MRKTIITGNIAPPPYLNSYWADTRENIHGGVLKYYNPMSNEVDKYDRVITAGGGSDIELSVSLNETEPGKALDATQGKVLNDSISNKIESPAVFTEGKYLKSSTGGGTEWADAGTSLPVIELPEIESATDSTYIPTQDLISGINSRLSAKSFVENFMLLNRNVESGNIPGVDDTAMPEDLRGTQLEFYEEPVDPALNDSKISYMTIRGSHKNSQILTVHTPDEVSRDYFRVILNNVDNISFGYGDKVYLKEAGSLLSISNVPYAVGVAPIGVFAGIAPGALKSYVLINDSNIIKYAPINSTSGANLTVKDKYETGEFVGSFDRIHVQSNELFQNVVVGQTLMIEKSPTERYFHRIIKKNAGNSSIVVSSRINEITYSSNVGIISGGTWCIFGGEPSWWREVTLTLLRKDDFYNDEKPEVPIEFIDLYNMSWPVTDDDGRQTGIEAGNGMRGIAFVLNGARTKKIRNSKLRNFYFDFSDYNPRALKAMTIKPNDTTLISDQPNPETGKYYRIWGRNRTSVKIHKRLEIGEVFTSNEIETDKSPHWIQEHVNSGYLAYQKQGTDESVFEVSTPAENWTDADGVNYSDNANVSEVRASRFQESHGQMESVGLFNEAWGGADHSMGVRLISIKHNDPAHVNPPGGAAYDPAVFTESERRAFKIVYGHREHNPAAAPDANGLRYSWSWRTPFQVIPRSANFMPIRSARHEFENHAAYPENDIYYDGDTNVYVEKDINKNLVLSDGIVGPVTLSSLVNGSGGGSSNTVTLTNSTDGSEVILKSGADNSGLVVEDWVWGDLNFRDKIMGVSAPSSPSSPGNEGDVAYAGIYMYRHNGYEWIRFSGTNSWGVLE